MTGIRGKSQCVTAMIEEYGTSGDAIYALSVRISELTEQVKVAKAALDDCVWDEGGKVQEAIEALAKLQGAE